MSRAWRTTIYREFWHDSTERIVCAETGDTSTPKEVIKWGNRDRCIKVQAVVNELLMALQKQNQETALGGTESCRLV